MKLFVVFCYLCVVFLIKVNAAQHLSDDQNLDMIDDYKDNDENEVRCFCNLPVCVMTGYMCKTTSNAGGGCFTDVAVSVPVQRAAHGCLDLLWDGIAPAVCQNDPVEKVIVRSKEQVKNLNSISSNKNVVEVPSSTSSSPSLLLCCFEDMCNHVDIPENHIKYNDTVMAAVLAGTRTSDMKIQFMPTHTTESLYDNNEVWFRAATIAVPICGALILFVLITLAVKILRSDIEDAKINGKFRSKHGGILPTYTPIQYNSATRMSGYPHQDNYEGKELKIIKDFSDTKLTTNKVPLLFNYQHDEMKNDHQRLANLLQYEHNINVVNESHINFKTNKTMYNDNNLKSDMKHKLNTIVNNKLKE